VAGSSAALSCLLGGDVDLPEHCAVEWSQAGVHPDRSAGVDEHMPADRLTTDQHSETHLVAGYERELDIPFSVEESDRGQDDRARRGVTARTAHAAHFVHGHLSKDDVAVVALKGVNLESNVRLAPVLRVLQIVGVQRRGPRARVDLGFDPIRLEAGSETHSRQPMAGMSSALVMCVPRASPSEFLGHQSPVALRRISTAASASACLRRRAALMPASFICA
jgi:hypothetical protein